MNEVTDWTIYRDALRLSAIVSRVFTGAVAIAGIIAGALQGIAYAIR